MAIYHIMQRGIRRKEIFTNQNDYYMFLTILAKELKRYQCELHAYCLMTNHYHFLLEVKYVVEITDEALADIWLIWER